MVWQHLKPMNCFPLYRYKILGAYKNRFRTLHLSRKESDLKKTLCDTLNASCSLSVDRKYYTCTYLNCGLVDTLSPAKNWQWKPVCRSHFWVTKMKRKYTRGSSRAAGVSHHVVNILPKNGFSCGVYLQKKSDWFNKKILNQFPNNTKSFLFCNEMTCWIKLGCTINV